MNRALLFLPALTLLPLTPLAAATATPPAAEQPATEMERAFRSALAAIEKANSDDFYEAACIVIEQSGDPTNMPLLMERAAKDGSPAATAWLALKELQGMSATGAKLRSDPRAIELRRRMFEAAAKGYIPATVQSSRLALMGVGAEPDEKLAIRYLMDASKRQSQQARALYLMVSGRLAKADFTLPEIASELGKKNHYLEELIAQMYGDTPDGVAWLRRASEHGSATAAFLLTQSSAAALEKAEALALFRLAAERHLPDAMAFLGAVELNSETLGLNVDIKADAAGGLRRLMLAAALGSPTAAHTLATAYGQQQAGPVSPELIYRLYRMAADQGEPLGMAGCGYCMLTGRGCPQDAVRGEALLRQAADKGAQWANQALASAYFNGFGVKPDMRAATNALADDAVMGSQHAYSIMAALIALGNGAAKPDPHRAQIYLELAKEEGDPNAQEVYDAIIRDKGWKFMPGLW